MILRIKLLSTAVLLFLGAVASQDAHAACVNPAGNEGEITYNTTYKTMQFCDGTKWWSMKGSITGDSLASKDFVNAAVAAGTSGNYSAPTEWSVSATAVQGEHGGDCSSLGAGWRMGSTIDLFYFHMNGVFPDPAQDVWITSLPDFQNFGSSSGSPGFPWVYTGRYGLTTFANNPAANCAGWNSTDSSIYGTYFYSNSGYVTSANCSASFRVFCVK